MKTALILQGWFQKSDSNWYPLLQIELEQRDYKVSLPDLPTMQTNAPNLNKQLAYIDQHCEINKDTVICGHSLGALLALRIAEQKPCQKLFLVAGWDFNDLTPEHASYWKKPIDHEQIKRNAQEIFCISSDNDPYFTAFQAEEMCKRLSGKFILIKGAGHFTEKTGVKKITEILKYV